MLPWLVGGALLVGGAFAARHLLKMLRKALQEEQGKEEATPDPDLPLEETDEEGEPNIGAGDEKQEDMRRLQEAILGQDALIQKIVNSVRFASAHAVIRQEVVGHREEPSMTPADDVRVRQMRGIGELPRVLPQTHGLDDEVYYGMVARSQLPVTEHIKRVGIVEDIIGEATNVLLVMVDVSGSMEFDDDTDNPRIRWAIKLCEKLVDRCLKEKAVYILSAFGTQIYRKIKANGPEELNLLRDQVRYFLHVGGGTAIHNSVLEGIDLLKEEGFTEARILLVTDGDDEIDMHELRSNLDEASVTLDTVCVGNSRPDLAAISGNYWELKS